VAQPAFFRAFAALVPQRPWTTWRAWLAARYLTALSPFVSNTLGDARFDFFGRILSGQVQPIPRWKRAISLINATLGDTIGREYVSRHFPRGSRDRVRRIVEHIVRAYSEALDQASWLSPAARGRARQKIAVLVTHVGYPDVWRTYRGLEIRADDLAGNIARAPHGRRVAHRRRRLARAATDRQRLLRAGSERSGDPRGDAPAALLRPWSGRRDELRRDWRRDRP
jgi:predicted metalloendopeptidase